MPAPPSTCWTGYMQEWPSVGWLAFIHCCSCPFFDVSHRLMDPGGSSSVFGHKSPVTLSPLFLYQVRTTFATLPSKPPLVPVGLFLMVLLYTLLSGIAIVENYRPILISPSLTTTAHPICGSTPPGLMVTQPTTVVWSSQCRPTLGCYPVIVTMNSHDSSRSFAL